MNQNRILTPNQSKSRKKTKTKWTLLLQQMISKFRMITSLADMMTMMKTVANARNPKNWGKNKKEDSRGNDSKSQSSMRVIWMYLNKRSFKEGDWIGWRKKPKSRRKTTQMRRMMMKIWMILKKRMMRTWAVVWVDWGKNLKRIQDWMKPSKTMEAIFSSLKTTRDFSRSSRTRRSSLWTFLKDIIINWETTPNPTTSLSKKPSNCSKCRTVTLKQSGFMQKASSSMVTNARLSRKSD